MDKILMVGSKGSYNEVVVDALGNRGFYIEYTEKIRIPDLLKIRKFDVVYGAYLQTCSRYIAAAKMMGKKTLIHFVGSDAYRYSREKGLRKQFWKWVIHNCDVILYVSSHLVKLVGKQGKILPFPIHVNKFTTQVHSPERDILYYCPGGDENARIYRLDWIIDYAKKHQDEKITIIGSQSHPAKYKVEVSNVEVIPFVPHERMNEVYAKHKQLIRMTAEDGMPRMVDEALLCGLDVIFNGKRIIELPYERNPEIFAQKFEEILLKIIP
jgi:hypothetical protein